MNLIHFRWILWKMVKWLNKKVIVLKITLRYQVKHYIHLDPTFTNTVWIHFVIVFYRVFCKLCSRLSKWKRFDQQILWSKTESGQRSRHECCHLWYEYNRNTFLYELHYVFLFIDCTAPFAVQIVTDALADTGTAAGPNEGDPSRGRCPEFRTVYYLPVYGNQISISVWKL